jgi:4-hydroxy-3-polyprenylbenzoate decarboxylase
MTMEIRKTKESGKAQRGYADFQDHIRSLDAAGLLVTIDAPINKDTEMHPLVRWQFRGGIPEAERKAFLFTNVTDSRGRRYETPVVIGALAANAAIYGIGMGVDIGAIGKTWSRAIQNPIPPRTLAAGACQEVVVTGKELDGEGRGLDALPVPISTPGYDCAPYLTAANCVTRDPDTGTQNMGMYRAGLKASNRLGVRMVARAGGAEGYLHWEKYKARGERMPCAFVLGGPPAVAYVGPQKLRIGLEEMAVAGGIVGVPINQVRAKSVDLMVPAEAEIVVEGWIDTDYLEPEAPFAESHGHVALEDYNMIMNVTAITRRRNALFPSIISQVTPSESSVIKRVAYEPLFLTHLRDQLGIKAVIRVSLHEPLTNLRRVIFIQMERGTPRTEVWRALYGATSLQALCGKYVIAINDDIDPENGDAIWWALAYRANPSLDIQTLQHRSVYGPRVERGDGEDSTLLVDATLKGNLPPVALPKPEYMEHAKQLWEKIGLPQLKPEAPWYGYSLGDWNEDWDQAALRAVEGNYLENGRRTAQQRRKDVKPNTSVRKATRKTEGNE